MISHKHNIGDNFPIQFAWQLPEGDYIRAVFESEVMGLDYEMERYILQLNKWMAGRQESATGEARATDVVAREYWQMVSEIAGKTIDVAFEADDGRALHLRLATLTGEHPFFTRMERIERMMKKVGLG